MPLTWYFRQDGELRRTDPTPDSGGAALGFDGKINFVLLLGVVALVLMSGMWKSSVQWTIAGTPVGLPGLLRDLGLIAITLVSLVLTPRQVHSDNQFGWGPMQEVAKAVCRYFLTIIPVIAMLKAGVRGPFGAIVSAVTRPRWPARPGHVLLGHRVAVLLPGQRAHLSGVLQHRRRRCSHADDQMATTLAAISAGSVFMGANTYIGNAPNLMVKAIAEDRGVKMPSFFGYMLWSCGILVPLFIAMTFIWLR